MHEPYHFILSVIGGINNKMSILLDRREALVSSTAENKKKFQASLYRNSIMLLIALPDFIAIIISTLIAYAARFPNVVGTLLLKG